MARGEDSDLAQKAFIIALIDDDTSVRLKRKVFCDRSAMPPRPFRQPMPPSVSAYLDACFCLTTDVQMPGMNCLAL